MFHNEIFLLSRGIDNTSEVSQEVSDGDGFNGHREVLRLSEVSHDVRLLSNNYLT